MYTTAQLPELIGTEVQSVETGRASFFSSREAIFIDFDSGQKVKLFARHCPLLVSIKKGNQSADPSCRSPLDLSKLKPIEGLTVLDASLEVRDPNSGEGNTLPKPVQFSLELEDLSGLNIRFTVIARVIEARDRNRWKARLALKSR